MTDNVAEFMQRVAAACGRDEPAPDPTLLWIKLELARREAAARRAGPALLATGVSLLGVLAIVWFFGFRPLRHAL